ncbi:hypothetical protein [Vitiosangium sp. GDMCC 1.1324]|uniref:hypothetical protein n=1 Tax=Vitiosangium sp. (strain GDMCC 1.1324) TaxID=2138576 RepID=UPI000D3D471E|nr:hypothetical protein [Vitiosangium sp. GDMCC 1.1324]PTL84974.1 hypothetical protein DAT35_07980 [Vitiosangium sp. GDMCC 1.1324]
MYTCPSCHQQFVVDAFLVGTQELTKACPRCNKGSKASVFVGEKGGVSKARTNLEKFANDIGGTLVTWIGQGDNPGQLLNEKLVQISEKEGRIDELGYPDALGGVCNAIVTEFLRVLLTGGSIAGFHQDMEFITDVYRQLQTDFANTMREYQLAAKLAQKNARLYEKYEALLSTGGAATPAIEDFWRSERDRAYRSVTDNSNKVQRLASLLYTTRNLQLSGIDYTMVQKNKALDETIIIKAVSEPGCYLFGLQGARAGHAVGISTTKNFFADDLLLFIDPNTGVFAFRDRNAFSFFITTYWKKMLKSDYSTGTICKYTKRKK